MTRTWSGAMAVAAGAALSLACGLAAGTARADVTVSEKTVFDGFGERGRMASEGTTTLVVSGDKMRQDSATKFTGRLAKRFTGEEGMKAASITRIDRRLSYQIDFRSKSYTEIPFESFKDLMGEMPSAGEAERPPEAERREPPLKCDPVQVEANRTGRKEDVNGFPSEEAVVTGTQACHNEESKQTCKNIYTLDTWATPVTPQLQELQAFNARLAEAMGLDAQEMQAMAKAAQGAMSQLGQGFGAVYKELSKVKGYPVRSRLTVEKEGSCGMMGGGEQGGVPGRDGGLSAMGDRFKGMFGRKKGGGQEREAPAKEVVSSAGRTKIFGMTTEIVSVKVSAAPADAFEPPAGFAKKETPKRGSVERTRPMKPEPKK